MEEEALARTLRRTGSVRNNGPEVTDCRMNE